MYIKKIFLFSCYLGIATTCWSQHFLGGQLLFTRTNGYTPPGSVKVLLEVYRTIDSSPRDSILFDWGDGHIDTFPRVASGRFPNINVLMDAYGGTHIYDTTGYMVCEYRDSFLVSGVNNIPNSGRQPLILQDTVLVFDSITSPYTMVR